MSRKSILFLSTQLPYPPNRGGTIKSWKYLSDLSKRYDMGLGCFLKDDDEDYLNEFRSKITLIEFVDEKLCIARSPLNLVKSYFGYPSLNVFRNYSKSFQSKIEKISPSYDAIIIDHYEMFQYIPKAYQGKVILHTHNAEFELWSRMAKLNDNPLMKLALRAEAKRVLKYEKSIIHRADLVYATPFDIATYKAAGITSHAIHLTYHLGNDELLQSPTLQFEHTEKALLFMGTLSWEPNIDGLLWFIQEVFPRIIEQHPDLIFYILGKIEEDDRLPAACEGNPNIKLCGFVKDIDQYLSKSRVFLAPLRFGSGMKVKVLEGMYRGIPMVTTKVGAEGIEVTDGEELMIADDAIDFANKVLQLLEDRTSWENLRDQSRKKAAELYTWQPLFDKMDQELSSILND